ncbi:cell elongation protein / DWARF1 / DIMINUTO, partial [Prunus dulcis]
LHSPHCIPTFTLSLLADTSGCGSFPLNVGSSTVLILQLAPQLSFRSVWFVGKRGKRTLETETAIFGLHRSHHVALLKFGFAAIVIKGLYLACIPSLPKMSDLETPLRPKRKTAVVDFLVQFRWIVVIFVVLPISFTIYFLTYLGDVRSEMKSYKRRQKEHDENVQKVVKRLKERNPSKDGLVCTARKPWIAVGMRNVDYKRARHFEVDLSAFRNVLEIDRERMIAKVEPLVNMGQITRVTVPLNLALAVVAEFDDLTVGGLINGYGIEGSSHIYGLFSDTVVAYEIVLADGRVVRATKDNEYSDLFYAIPWSQGTLGLLVSAEIKLIPIKEYMRLTYKPVVGNLQDIAQAYSDSFAPRDGDQDNPEKVPDFVETMIYTPTEAVCMTGRYASKEEAKKKGNVINEVGWWFKPWFYQHAQKALKKGEFVEYIPTREYYHRHTRSIYWEGKLILPFADQWWFRFFLGWMMPPRFLCSRLLKVKPLETITTTCTSFKTCLFLFTRLGML